MVPTAVPRWIWYSSDPFSRLPVKRWSGSPTPGISGLQLSDGQVPPEIFYHGHVHMSYGRNQKRYDQYNQTHVINAYDRCVFDYEDDNLREHLKRWFLSCQTKNRSKTVSHPSLLLFFIFLYLCFLTVAYSLPVRSVYTVLIGFFSWFTASVLSG